MGIPAVLPRRIISRSPVFLAQRYKPDTKDFSNIEHARGKLPCYRRREIFKPTSIF